MRVAIYLRVSTGRQTVENQRAELLVEADARGWDVVAEYVDEGVSGAKAARPGLDRLLADARHRRFDAVVVWKLDRLARSLRHLLALKDELQERGIGLVSLRDPGFDTTSPQGQLVFQILGAVGEFERELIRERIRAGMARAKRCPSPGKRRPGRPRSARVDLAQAWALLAAGSSVAAAARELGVSRGALRYRLAETLA